MSAADKASVDRWRGADAPTPPTAVFTLNNRAKHVLVRLFDDAPGTLEMASDDFKRDAVVRSRLAVVFSSQHDVPDAVAMEPGKWIEVPLRGKAQTEGHIKSMLLHVDDDRLLNGYDIYPRTAPNPNDSAELCIDSICALRAGTLASQLATTRVRDRCVGCDVVTTLRCVCQTVPMCSDDCRSQTHADGRHAADVCVKAMTELLQSGAGKDERPGEPQADAHTDVDGEHVKAAPSSS